MVNQITSRDSWCHQIGRKPHVSISNKGVPIWAIMKIGFILFFEFWMREWGPLAGFYLTKNIDLSRNNRRLKVSTRG